MFPINFLAHCPKCKETKLFCTGTKTIVKYKEEYYTMLYCPDCEKKIISKTIEYQDKLSQKTKDNTKTKIIYKIFEKFHNSNYTNKTPEEKIEQELFHFVEETMGGKWTYKYEYEVKSVIQTIISNEMNIPKTSLKSYLYEDVKKDCKIESTILY